MRDRYLVAGLNIIQNKSLMDSAEVFNDRALAMAIPGRLAHRQTTTNIKGENHPLKTKRKAGILGMRLEGREVDEEADRRP